jgi:hypothetical protein
MHILSQLYVAWKYVLKVRSKILLRRYISTNIMFLDTIHRHVFIEKHRPVYFPKHKVSETGFCLRLGPSIELGTSSINWPQLSRFYLKTETDWILSPSSCAQSIELVPISGDRE